MTNYIVTDFESTDIRETLALTGFDKASNEELLEVALQYGQKKSCKELSAKLLESISLIHFSELTPQELTNLGLSVNKALAISSIIELTKRSLNAKKERQERVYGSEMLGKRLCKTYGDKKQEHLVVLYLDAQNRILEERVIFIGSTTRSIAEPKEILHYAIKNLAKSIILAHNHPSGGLQPSPNDNAFTSKMEKVCELMDVTLLDHLIVTEHNGYYSYREDGKLG
ncbi:TPA: DNA repair protein RadC [Streptococcus suis]